MRAHVKKRRYKMHLREQVAAGYGNKQDGNWAPSTSFGGADSTTFKNLRCGYRL